MNGTECNDLTHCECVGHLWEIIKQQHKALKNLQSRVSNDADAHAWWQDEQVAAIDALAKAAKLGVKHD